MTLARDASVNAVSNVVLAVLGIASGSLISYRFGPEGRGVVGAAQVVAALCAGIGSLGLGDALLYRIASGRVSTRGLVLLSSGLATLGGTVLGTTVGTIVGRSFDPGSGTGGFILFSALASAATAFFLVPSGALRGQGRFLAWNVARVTATVAWIVALLAGGTGDEISLSVVAIVYSAALLVIGSVALWSCRLGPALPPPDRSAARLGPAMRSLLAFGLPSAFATAPLLLNARIDQVALALVNTTEVVGQYVAAAGYCWATVPLGQAIASLTATRVAGHTTHTTRVTTLRQLTSIGVTVIGLSGVVAWLLAPVALRVLNGPGFDDAVGIARVLLVGATLQSITFLLEEGARGLGRPRLPMYAELLGLAVMTVLLVVLTSRGAIPTAIASTTGYVVSFAVITRGVTRAGHLTWWSLLRPAGARQLRSAIRAGTE